MNTILLIGLIGIVISNIVFFTIVIVKMNKANKRDQEVIKNLFK